MPTKTEKGIHLDFPQGWTAVKYDGDTKEDNAGFYRAKIEHQVQHVRGVDIVTQAAAPDNRLLLIEVKDYRVSASSAEREAKKLRQTVIQKALNTIALPVCRRPHRRHGTTSGNGANAKAHASH